MKLFSNSNKGGEERLYFLTACFLGGSLSSGIFWVAFYTATFFRVTFRVRRVAFFQWCFIRDSTDGQTVR